MKKDAGEEVDYYGKLKDKIFAGIMKNLSGDERVLDIGCGGCGLVEYLAGSENIYVVGLDIDGEKFKDTARKIPREIKTKIRCVKGDAENLNNFKNGSFSAVTSLYSLHEIAHPLSALKECNRILKERGKIVVVDFLENTIAEKLYSEKYFSPEGIKTLMADAGFTVVSQKLFSTEGPAITTGYKNRRKCAGGIKRIAFRR
ncbi:MAG: methyltransferase domain-containing protein [Candidatus Omnitrophica bacterium]|nr:methyltransferase domain-containing protein [Candidatus Omnitrophota bacterium]